jgi:anti-sigma regulatory factor (Ser/Thr protein kinase)
MSEIRQSEIPVIRGRASIRPEPDGLGHCPNEVEVRGAVGRRDSTTRTRLALPSSTRSPSLARALVAEAMLGFPADTVDTAMLLVSEIVTNAVRHAAGSPLILTVTTAPERVGASLEATSREPPSPGAAGLDAETGRGLELVDALATTWGWRETSPGKVVWFELELTPSVH